MRSVRPIPGNPWPHDMTLTITDDHEGLLELLWVRAAWDLHPTGADLPPEPEIAPSIAPSVQSLRRNKQQWEQAWTELWSGVLQAVARPREEDVFESLHDAEPGSPERARLLEAFTGPSWRDRFDDSPFDDEYRRWTTALSAQTDAEHRLSLDQTPERLCLDALVPAWRRGLTTVIPIPCVGMHTRTIGAHGLLLTAATRADPARYRDALETFAPA